MKVIEDYSSIIDNLVYKYKNIIDMDEEDIKQELYMKIIIILDAKKDKLGEYVYPYITTCLKNLIMDLIRATTRLNYELVYDDMKQVASKEVYIRKSMREVLDGLNDEEIRIALLYMDGLFQEEIGEILGLSQSTVSNRLKDIREKIEKNL